MVGYVQYYISKQVMSVWERAAIGESLLGTDSKSWFLLNAFVINCPRMTLKVYQSRTTHWEIFFSFCTTFWIISSNISDDFIFSLTKKFPQRAWEKHKKGQIHSALFFASQQGNLQSNLCFSSTWTTLLQGSCS